VPQIPAKVLSTSEELLERGAAQPKSQERRRRTWANGDIKLAARFEVVMMKPQGFAEQLTPHGGCCVKKERELDLAQMTLPPMRSSFLMPFK
jgi:hypothetical protein